MSTAVGPAGRTPIPAAGSIRAYTAAVARLRADGGLTAVLGDVYYAVVVTGIGVLVALGALQQLPVADPPDDALGLSFGALTWPAVALGAGLLVSTAGRLGPVGVGGAQAQWWLTLPVGRRGLLLPVARRALALSMLVAALVAGVLDAALAGVAVRAVRVGVAAGLAAGVLVSGAALVQAWRGSRVLVRAGDALVAAGGVVAIGVLVAGRGPELVLDAPWWLLLVLATGVAGAFAPVPGRLERIHTRSLRESGAVASQATGALVSFDTRELGRALTDRVARQERRRSLRPAAVRGPVGVVVVADLLVLVRSPRHLAQLVGSAVVPLLVVATPRLAGPAQVALALLVAGAVAMTASTEGARRAELMPGLDRLLPLSAVTLRRVRLLVPAAVMTVWSLAAFAAVGVWHGDPGRWLVLGLLAGPAWAGAALRSAYRPAPRWDAGVVATPSGALPMGAAAVIAQGPDALVLGLLPAMVAVLVGAPQPILLQAQVLTTALALAWGSRTTTVSVWDREREEAR